MVRIFFGTGNAASLYLNSWIIFFVCDSQLAQKILKWRTVMMSLIEKKEETSSAESAMIMSAGMMIDGEMHGTTGKVQVQII